VDFYIVEYPGYGGRKGKPTQVSILAAAEDALGNIHGNGPVFLVGESLGTGVATYLAGKHDREIARVFLVAPYDLMTAVAASHLPLFPVKWMLHDKYPSSTWLQGYHGRLAVLLAGKDTVVPRELGQNLFDGYGGLKKLWVEPGATHEDVHRPKKEVFRNVLEFWDEH
jgi:alpha-beta hydrolase superfamily lysophospholipase